MGSRGEDGYSGESGITESYGKGMLINCVYSACIGLSAGLKLIL